jgi:hypothetical protein
VNKLNLSEFEISNPVTTMLADFKSSVSPRTGKKLAKKDRERLKSLVDNAKAELIMWGDAIGHVSWFASTHEEADKKVAQSLGMISMMQGKFLNLIEELDDLEFVLTSE